jgi:histidinol-phosphate aminotransferase
MTNLHKLVKAEINGLPRYNAGSSFSKLKKEFGVENFTKLDSNENAFGFSPNVFQAIQEASQEIFRYPDRDGDELRNMLSEMMGAPADQFIFGDGSEQLIQVAYQTVVRPGDHVVTVCPGFGLYEIYGVMAGARVTKVNYTKDWRFPVEETLDALRDGARILALCSPSNPVGACLDPADFDRLLAEAPAETLIIMDEAYYEFVPKELRLQSIARLQAQSRPWLVLRTFSKAYGLAGLRIGYGVASSEEFAAALNKVRTPFSVNSIALAAASAALKDQDYLDQCVSKITQERNRVASSLADLGYSFAPSHTNFLFIDIKQDGGIFAQEALRQGVYVKAWHEDPYRNYIRVSIGLPEENDRFLSLFS